MTLKTFVACWKSAELFTRYCGRKKKKIPSKRTLKSGNPTQLPLTGKSEGPIRELLLLKQNVAGSVPDISSDKDQVTGDVKEA